MKILAVLGLFLALSFVATCSHKKAEITPAEVPGFKGPPAPAGGSIVLPEEIPSAEGPGLPTGRASQPPPGIEGIACPADGSFLVVDRYLDVKDKEKILGSLTGTQQPVLGNFLGHAGGRINDFHVYKEGSDFFLLLNYGADLMRKRYNTEVTLAKAKLPFPVEKILVFPYQNKNWAVVSTVLGLHFFETKSLREIAKIPFPSKVTNIYNDNEGLYAATEDSNIYRLPLDSMKGGCVERVASKKDFLGRVFKKIQAAQGKLFILSEKSVVPSDRISLESLPDYLRPLGEPLLKMVSNVIESIWDPMFVQMDVIDLDRGTKTTIPSGDFAGYGRVLFNDFFIHQNKLFLVANHLLKDQETFEFQNSLNRLLEFNCASAEFRCPAGANALIQIGSHVLFDIPLPRWVVPDDQPLVDFHYKPAGLVIFSNWNRFTNPQIIPVTPPNNVADADLAGFWKGLWDVKGAANGDDIYLVSSRAIAHFGPKAGGGFEQKGIPYYLSPPAGFPSLRPLLRSVRQTLKVGYVKEGDAYAILKLRGLLIDRGLEHMVPPFEEDDITEYSSFGLPRTILGRRGNDIYTHLDWARIFENIFAKWQRVNDNEGTAIAVNPPPVFPNDHFSWDPVSGNFTFVRFNDGGTRDNAGDDVYETRVVNGDGQELLRLKDIPFEENVRAVHVACDIKTEHFLKGVRSIGGPAGGSGTHFMLFKERYSLSCPDNVAPFQTALVIRSFDNIAGVGVQALPMLSPAGPVANVVEVVRINLVQFNGYDAWFEGGAHRTDGNDAAYVLARSVDGLFLVKRFEDRNPPQMGKTLLVPKVWIPTLVVSDGKGDSLLLTKTGNQFAKFYRYSWTDILDSLNTPEASPPQLFFVPEKEILYDSPLEPLYGDLSSILTLDDNHCLIRILSHGSGSRLELLKIDNHRFTRLASQISPELLDVGFDQVNPGNIVLGTSNNGLEFYDLSALMRP